MNTMIITYILYWVCFPLLCLIGINRQTDRQVLLDKEDSTFCKGFAAIGVFLAHCYNFLVEGGESGTKILIPFSVLGGMGVLIFFFLGGYGIGKTYGIASDSKLQGYWKKRLINVYIPTVIILLISAIVNATVSGVWSVLEILKTSLLGSWYIDVAMLEYLFFYFAKKLFKTNWSRVFALEIGLNIILFVVFAFMNLEPRWRNGLLMFPFGLLIAWQEHRIIEWLRKRWLSILIIMVVFFISTGALFIVGKGELWADPVKNLSGCALVMILICLMRRIKFGNVVMTWIGKRSLYVYLIHLTILEYIKRLSAIKASLRIIILLLSTVILSEIAFGIKRKFVK